MMRMLHDFLAQRMIPTLFCLRGGKEISLLQKQDLSYLGVESILVESAYDVTFDSGWDWNSIPLRKSELAMPVRRLPAEAFHFVDSYVYKLDRATFGDCTKRWGVIALPGAKVLLTGFSRQRFHLATLVPRNPLKIRREKIILCPEPYPNGTYGDILNVTLPRLCRILRAMPDAEKKEACVAMPFKLEVAHQLVELLGIPRERHINTLTDCFGLTRDGWAYTCNTPLKIMVGKGDYEYMRNRLFPEYRNKGHKRIYVQRQGRRKILQEREYLHSLLDMGFEVFDDRPRSIEEQMEFFNGAEIIVAAHGAGMANMLWANPDVSIVEVRDAGWWMNCFRLWSLYNGAQHELLVDWSRFSEPTWNISCISSDLNVNIHGLLRVTQKMLASQ